MSTIASWRRTYKVFPESADQGNLPIIWGCYPTATNCDPTKAVASNGVGNVFFHLWPYMEQDNLYRACLVNNSYDPGQGGYINGQNVPTYWHRAPAAFNAIVRTLICPSDPTVPSGAFPNGPPESYAGNCQVFSNLNEDPFGCAGNGYGKYPSSISDGTSNTIFFSERMYYCTNPSWGGVRQNSWVISGYGPYSFGCPSDPQGAAAIFQVQPNVNPAAWVCLNPSTGHTGGINCALGDGSVRFVSQGISGTTWWFAITPSGGEVLGPDWQ